MIQVEVLDGHSAVLDALSSRIAGENDMVFAGSTSSAEEAYIHLETRRPDVLILEVHLPGAYGIDVAAKVHKAYEDLKIVFYSMNPEIIYAERALLVGASAYIMKSEPTTSVVEAVRRVARGQVVLSAAITSHIVRHCNAPDSHDMLLHRTNVLTDRELAVFHLIGRSLSAEEIARILGLVPRTVETYRTRIKDKLGIDSTPELVQYAFECSEPSLMSR